MAGERRRAPALLGCIAVVGLLLGACGDAGTQGDEAAKRPAPDFEHEDLDGNAVRLSALRGQTVVIDFWATWCAPCVFQPPELNQVWQAHRDSGRVTVLGVEIGGATPDEIREWGEENDARAEYPLLSGADEDLARRFGAIGFPATVVVGPDGSIDSITVGLQTAAEVEQSIAHLLERS